MWPPSSRATTRSARRDRRQHAVGDQHRGGGQGAAQPLEERATRRRGRSPRSRRRARKNRAAASRPATASANRCRCPPDNPMRALAHDVVEPGVQALDEPSGLGQVEHGPAPTRRFRSRRPASRCRARSRRAGTPPAGRSTTAAQGEVGVVEGAHVPRRRGAPRPSPARTGGRGAAHQGRLPGPGRTDQRHGPGPRARSRSRSASTPSKMQAPSEVVTPRSPAPSGPVGRGPRRRRRRRRSARSGPDRGQAIGWPPRHRGTCSSRKPTIRIGKVRMPNRAMAWTSSPGVSAPVNTRHDPTARRATMRPSEGRASSAGSNVARRSRRRCRRAPPAARWATAPARARPAGPRGRGS